MEAKEFFSSERIVKIHKAVQCFHPHKTVSAFNAQHLLGLMASTTVVMLHARLKMRLLQAWFLSQFDPMGDNPTKCLRVPRELVNQLTWWTSMDNLSSGRPVAQPHPSIQVTTDTSPLGWGAYCQELQMHGLWTQRERMLHINQIEMLTIINAFRAFLPRLEGKTVQLVTDNTMATHYVKRQGGTHSLPLLNLTIEFWEWCYAHHIFPRAIHISSEDNYLVDHLSRLPTQIHEW